MENEKELEKVMDEAENEKEEDKTQAQELVDLVMDSNAILFHDQFMNALIATQGDGRKIIRLRSREFKTWLSHLGWIELGKAIAASTIETAVRTLEGHAIHEGEEFELQVRVARLEESIWYDLGEGKAVEITKDKWAVIENPPILFNRFTHQRPQVMPVEGGELKEAFNFLPTPKYEHQRLLLLVSMVAAFMPNFPHPLLVIHGPQGSRKTTLSKLLRRLIDPSVMETLTPYRDMKEFVQLAAHHYFLPLDNMSPISSEFSDALCRTVTGEGMSKRELYSDDEDIIYSFRRIIAVNGINLVVSKPDLLERSIMIELERPEEYEEESKLLALFEEARPFLLGALFTAVHKSMQLFPTVKVPSGIETFRMADFVRWGCVIAPVLGYSAEEFVEALKINLANQHEEAIDESPVAQIILAFMEDKREWQNTPTVLFEELKKKAIEVNIDIKQKSFPKAPNWLWKKIQVAATNLLAKGIKVERDKDGERFIRLINTSTPAVLGVSAVPDDGPDGKGYDFDQLPAAFSFGNKEEDGTDSIDSI